MYQTKRLLALLTCRPLYCFNQIGFSFTRASSYLYNNIQYFHTHNNMASSDDNVIPILDKDIFRNDFNLIALKIPAKQCTEFTKTFKDYVWKRPRMKKILNVDDDPNSRLLLLSEDKVKATDGSDLPKELKSFIQERGGTITSHLMTLTYDNLSVEEVLQYFFPDRVDTPTSFEQCGHLAHMNLRPEYIKNKHIIGQVIIDKIPQIKTVVNKIGNIETHFRTFPMELAGEDNYNVTLREYG